MAVVRSGEDSLLLARRFLKEFNRRLGKPPRELSPAVAERFLRYPWHGNVLEGRDPDYHTALIVQWHNGKKEIVWPRKYSTARPIFPAPPWNRR